MTTSPFWRGIAATEPNNRYRYVNTHWIKVGITYFRSKGLKPFRAARWAARTELVIINSLWLGRACLKEKLYVCDQPVTIIWIFSFMKKLINKNRTPLSLTHRVCCCRPFRIPGGSVSVTGFGPKKANIFGISDIFCFWMIVPSFWPFRSNLYPLIAKLIVFDSLEVIGSSKTI